MADVRVTQCYIGVLYVPMLSNSTIIELLFLSFSSDGTVDLRCTRSNILQVTTV